MRLFELMSKTNREMCLIKCSWPSFCVSVLKLQKNVRLLFMIYTLLHVFEYFLSICFHQSTLAFFWAFVKLCRIQREQIFFAAKYSCNILYKFAELMRNVDSISQYVTRRSCIINCCTALIFSGPITDFGRFLRHSSVSEWWPRLNSIYQRFTEA